MAALGSRTQALGILVVLCHCMYNEDCVCVCVCVSVPYSAVQRVTNDGSSLLLEVLSDDGAVAHHQLRLASRLLANALYRTMTEKYYFYHCDTVGRTVMLQSSRDFKGTLASLFNENTEMGLFQLTSSYMQLLETCVYSTVLILCWLCDKKSIIQSIKIFNVY